jgi:hypothetical protein
MRNRRIAFVEPLELRQLFSTTYFVDPTGATVSTDPSVVVLATVADVNAQDFNPGDAVLFKGGLTFSGSISLGPEDAGTADQPVRLSSFDGVATVAAGTNNGLVVTNAAGIDVSDLTIVGSGQGPATPDAQPISKSGIWFVNTASDARLDHVSIDHVDVSGFGRYGILIGTDAGTVKRGFDHVSITNSAVHGNQLGGIASLGAFSATAAGYAHSNFYLAHNEVFDNPGFAKSSNHSGDGIVMSDVDGITIERNVAHDNGALNGHSGGPVGIWVWDTNNATIQYNESHHNHTNSTADGGGFDLDGGVTNSVIQYNYSHDNDGPGYGIYQFSGARPFNNNDLRYNISANDGRKNSYGAIDFWNGGSGISNVRVYNNTVYLAPSTKQVTTTTTSKGKTITTTSTVTLGNPRGLRIASGLSNVSIRNNIFQTSGGAQLAQIDAKSSSLLIQGNDWWSSAAAFSIKTITKTYASLSSWASATGYELLGGAVVGKSVDPQFQGPILSQDPVTKVTFAPTVGIADVDVMSARLTAFKLSSTSSLRDAGLNLFSRFQIRPGSNDFFGTALPATDADLSAFRFDIGAHEYL